MNWCRQPLLTAFILVFVWTYTSLGMSGIFSGFTRWVIAVCVAMLSATGLLWGFRPAGASISAPTAVETRPRVQFVLLPYAALGLTLQRFAEHRSRPDDESGQTVPASVMRQREIERAAQQVRAIFDGKAT